MDSGDKWSSEANEALSVSFVVPGEHSPQTLASFAPQFTYPIFGDEEAIFGYTGLSIKLRFSAHDLKPNVAVKYDTKIDATGETKATDIEGELKKFLPAEAFENTQTFNDYIQNSEGAAAFQPPGELLETYTSKGRDFEIWSVELGDARAKLLIGRIQVLISLFIEAGTPLDLEDQPWSLSRWRVYFAYEKLHTISTSKASKYALVGYSTSYRFITCMPSKTRTHAMGLSVPPNLALEFPLNSELHPNDLPARIRISQFLILPSHHSHGHGSHLYSAMVHDILRSPTCIEITVEDPNEAFDDLRDYVDFARLTQDGLFEPIKINLSVSPALTASRPNVRVPTSALIDTHMLENLRAKCKLAPRQFSRLIELYLFSQIPQHTRQAGTARLTQRAKASNQDDRMWYYWRLLVKQRVYKQNKDLLMQVDKSERAEKVEETVGGIASDYERLLAGLQKWMNAKEKSLEGTPREHNSLDRKGVKRARVLLDEEEDLESVGSTKRARSEVIEQ